MVSFTFKINNTSYAGLVERDSYETTVIPVYGETIKTMDGVSHTARLRVRGVVRVKLNPTTDSDTAAICADLLNTPVEVQYHCLQRNTDVTALMTIDELTANFLSRCKFKADDWNQLDEITLTEL